MLDLTKSRIRLSRAVGNEIVFTGLRDGKKTYEELLVDEESTAAICFLNNGMTLPLLPSTFPKHTAEKTVFEARA